MTPGHAFLAVMVAHFLGENLKALINYRKKGRFRLFDDGGFPSGHATTMSALATAVFLVDGFSILFVVVIFLLLVVVHDSLNVRSQVGKHASILNKLSKGILKEDTGHTLSEALAGLVLGVLVVLSYNQFT